jgi:hypothetical protein
MFRGRRSAGALAEDARGRGADIAGTIGSAAGDVGSRAADTMSDLADRAAELAREAQKAATPVIRSAMSTAAERAREAQRAATPVVRSATATAAEALSDAAEHAAEVLSETAGRLAQQGAEQADELQLAARSRLADASEHFAGHIRPRRRRGLRLVLVVAGVAGAAGAVAGVMASPLGLRLRRMCGLAPAEAEPAAEPGILLPGDQPASAPAPGTAQGGTASGQPGTNGDRILAGGRVIGTSEPE